MTINWWALGLQAVNVLILVWLLSRFFWRPLAKVIATRQDVAQGMLNDAKTAQAEVDAALGEVTATRAGMAAEREALLAEATAKAATTAKAAREEAATKAETVLKAARRATERENDAARTRDAADAALLAVDIARKLLARLDTAKAQAPLLDLFVEAIERMSPGDRQALVGTVGGIDLASARELDDAGKAKVTDAVWKALGGSPTLNFLTDPDLIAGFEMRTAHFTLRDSWESDLAAILADLKHAA